MAQGGKMKHSLNFMLALTLFLAACGSGDITPKPDPNPSIPDGTVSWTLPSSNTPVGELVSGVAGVRSWVTNAGDTVFSADGLARLIVPNGAFPDGGWVAIDTVNSSAPNFLGATYRFDVGTLSKAALLEFPTPSDSSSSQFVVLRQNSTGDWQAMPNSQLLPSNSPNQKVQVSISSGGDYALSARYKLHPSRTAVKVNASLPMTVISLASLDPNNLSNLEVKPIAVDTWAVNGVTNGNASLGTLIATNQPNQRTYKAPSKKPNPNPVTVSAKIGQTTYISSIKIEDSQGWTDFFSTAQISKTINTPPLKQTLNAEFQGQFVYEASQISAVAPTTVIGTDIPGYLSAVMALKPNSIGTASVTFTSKRINECICTPKEGQITIKETYTFTAADELKPEFNNLLSATGEIQKSGAYEVKFSDIKLLLNGDFEYERITDYPCGGQNPFPSVKRSGKDVVRLTGTSKNKLTGNLRPQGPDSLQGTNYDHSSFVVLFPQKTFLFAPVPASSVFSWFFPYAPSTTQTAPFRPQSHTPSRFSSLALPGAEEAAGIFHQPRC
jgi:hypothetical protein